MPEKNQTTLGERIAAMLEERGMTQKELAVKAGVTEAAVSHYVKGDRIPRSSVLQKIADALGTTSDFLFGGEAQDGAEEVDYATRLLMRNASQMTKEQKKMIIDILLSVDDG